MSLEQQIEALTRAVQANNELLAAQNELLKSASAIVNNNIGPVGTTADTAAVDAPAETADKPVELAPGRKRKPRAAPVTQPTVDPATTAAAAEEGFGDEGFDDGFGDDGFGEEEAPAAAVKAYTGDDARNSLKALRDAISAGKGSDQGLAVAKAALKETGFGNINDIKDEHAAGVIEVALRYAVNHGVLDAVKTKAKQFGSDL